MLEAFEGIVVLVHRFKDGENQLHMSSRKENILALTGVDVNFCNKCFPFGAWGLQTSSYCLVQRNSFGKGQGKMLYYSECLSHS